MRSFAVPAAVVFGGLLTLLACSGAEKQDVLASQVGSTSTSTSASSSGTSGLSSTSSASSSSGNKPPPDPGDCQDEGEENNSPATATEFEGAICGTLSGEDRTDFIRFTIPEGSSAKYGFRTDGGEARLFFTGGGAINLEARDGNEIAFVPGEWLVRVQRNGGGGDDFGWRFEITIE